jgi:hypothetical protein
MRQRIVLVLLSAGLWAAAGPLLAAGASFSAAVPFEFVAGDETFPAREECRFELGSRSNQVSLRGKHASTIVQASELKFMGDVFKDPPRNELIFHRYGDRYFLAEVWIKSHGVELPKSKDETQLLEGGAQPRSVALKVKTR